MQNPQFLSRASAWLSAFAAAFVLLPLAIHAGKPSSANPPSGLIYYQATSAAIPGSTSQLFRMRADGSQKTGLAITFGHPSALNRGGARWILKSENLRGETNLRGWQRAEMFAVREDGSARVQLTNDPAMGIHLQWTPAESAGEAVLAGLGQRWNADGTLDPASLGIYTAILRFDATGNVLGLDTAPAFLTSVGTIHPYGADGEPTVDCNTFSFSPDMTRIVADHYWYGASWPLRVLEIATGAESSLGVMGDSPAWSPDGLKIAYRTQSLSGQGVSSIEQIAPNGSNRATIVKTRSGYFYSPVWSPDSAFIAIDFQDLSFTQNDIYRVSATGASSAVNLTTEIGGGTSVLGWR
jgi:hypothetical protein